MVIPIELGGGNSMVIPFLILWVIPIELPSFRKDNFMVTPITSQHPPLSQNVNPVFSHAKAGESIRVIFSDRF